MLAAAIYIMEEGEAKLAEMQQPLHITSSIIPQTSSSSSSPKKYYLSIDHYKRRSQSLISSTYNYTNHKQQQQLAAPSSYNLSSAPLSSSSRRVATTIPGELDFRSLWEEDVHVVQESTANSTSTSSSLHMQELLSQLASSISAMTTAFSQVQASLNTYHIVGHNSTSEVEKAMVAQEFQRLLDLDRGLHSLLVQQYDIVTEGEWREKPENHKCTICDGATELEENNMNIEKKDAMVKSYEGIITRFLDEIRRKEAVIHALKDTLAKSLLRGEKLQRRMKALEMKTSPVPPPT